MPTRATSARAADRRRQRPTSGRSRAGRPLLHGPRADRVRHMALTTSGRLAVLQAEAEPLRPVRRSSRAARIEPHRTGRESCRDLERPRTRLRRSRSADARVHRRGPGAGRRPAGRTAKSAPLSIRRSNRRRPRSCGLSRSAPAADTPIQVSRAGRLDKPAIGNNAIRRGPGRHRR